jgi:hypothetical protein
MVGLIERSPSLNALNGLNRRLIKKFESNYVCWKVAGTVAIILWCQARKFERLWDMCNHCVLQYETPGIDSEG